MDKEVRTRFAPSPTGYMHIGNLRTALYCYLYAKHNKGTFILRIEDTDQKRLVDGAVDVIYRTLKMSKLFHDEGPDVGGEYGPYVQTQRLDIYKKYAMQLIEQGDAYYCFCGKDDAEHEEEEHSTGYNRHCRNLSKEQVKYNLSQNMPYVIRQKVPESGTTTFHDEVYGDITVDNSTLDDQVLIKSDGLPTYNFANVIDDHCMNITHVMRGKEYIVSTPKYQLLYQAFGWTPPKTAHLSTIMGMNADGTVSKLSKRHGAVSFEQLVKDGYLVDAIINYIALLGWSPKSENEIYTLPQLVELFDLDGLVKTNAIFDYKKLAWMNSEYIKKMDADEFVRKSSPYAQNLPQFVLDKWPFVAGLLQGRISVLSEIEDSIKFLYNYTDFDLTLLENKKNKLTIDSSCDVLKNMLPKLEEIDDWSNENINSVISDYATKNELKIGYVMWPLRISVTGQTVTPGGASEMMYILGKDEAIARIRKTINRVMKNN